MVEVLAHSVGRRKTSVARVFLKRGSGNFIVNGKNLDEYFPLESQRIHIVAPLEKLGVANEYDVYSTVKGGGITGQRDALRLGLARALIKIFEEKRVDLKREGFLTRDARVKESKKYGLKKARKAPQYTKR